MKRESGAKDLISRPSIEQTEALHNAAVAALWDPGARVEDAELLKQLEGAGARVEGASGRVRLPAELIEERVALTPSSYAIRNVLGEAFEVGGQDQGIMAITNDPWILDYPTGRPRRPVLDDVRRHTIIAQRTAGVRAATCMDFPVADAAGDAAWRALEVHLKHHALHYPVYAASYERYQEWERIGGVLAGDAGIEGSRLFTVAVAVVSPLVVNSLNARLLWAAIGNGFPVVPTICPMAGSTGPYSQAGLMVLSHAENLLMAVLTQLAHPGHPFCYGFGPSRMDMNSGHDLYYTLDKVLWKQAQGALARRVGMPFFVEMGGALPPRYDAQTGAEGMLFMLGAVASGASILAGLGSCYNANGMSAEQMMLQRGWLAAARFLNRDIDCGEARLALEAIREAGPGGHFMTDALTLEGMRSGAFFDDVRFGGPEDAKTMLERAHEEAEALVADYESPVPGTIREGLDRYFAEYHGVRG